MVCTINSFQNLDLPKEFGMDVDHVDDDPTQHTDLLPGSTFQSGNVANRSAPEMQTMQGSKPLYMKSKKDDVVILKPAIKKVQGANPTSSTSDRILTNRQLVQRAIDAGCTDVEQVIEWVPKNHHTKVGRRDAERCFKELTQ